MDIVIYHNPACEISRNALELIHPIGVGVCRPSEVVLDLLPVDDFKPFTKEDGEIVIDAAGQRVKR